MTVCLQCTKCKQSFIFHSRNVICPECGNTELIDSPDAKWLSVDNGGEEIINARIRLEKYESAIRQRS